MHTGNIILFFLTNVKRIPKPLKAIKYADIRNFFPLYGEYIFRFKYKNKQRKIIWIDITNEKAKLPLFDNRIMIKVLRKS